MTIQRSPSGAPVGPQALPDGSTAVTQPSTDSSTKPATTEFCWKMPAWQQNPDGTVANGNARGANATDWQSLRNNANQVASGANSVIGGGQINIANGASAVIAGGTANNASGNTASIMGGANNIADGTYSAVLGGWYASARATYGKMVFASGRFLLAGDAQLSEMLLSRQTTSAAATRLTSDRVNPSNLNTANLPNNGLYRIHALVVARQVGGNADVKEWEVHALVKRGANAAATATVGTPSVVSSFADSGASAWALAVAADTTFGGIAFTGTGEDGKTINWVARISSVEVVG